MKLSLQPRAKVSNFIHNFVSARADEDLLCKKHFVYNYIKELSCSRIKVSCFRKGVTPDKVACQPTRKLLFYNG